MDATLDQIAATDDWSQASNKELAEAITELDARMRRDYATLLAVIHEADLRDPAAAFGCRTLSEALQRISRITRFQARRRIRHARATRPWRSPDGVVVSAPLPQVAAAMAEGALSAEHLDAIISSLRALPNGVATQKRERAQESLVYAARTLDPQSLATLGRCMREPRDPSTASRPRKSTAPQTSSERAGNQLWWRRRNTGRLEFGGELEPEVGAALLGLVTPLAKPQPAQGDQEDTHATAQRHGEGFAVLLRRVADSRQEPAEDSLPSHLNLAALPDMSQSEPTQASEFPATRPGVEAEQDLAEHVAVSALDTRSVPEGAEQSNRGVPDVVWDALLTRIQGCTCSDCQERASWDARFYPAPGLAG